MREIGYQALTGPPPTQKQLLLLDVGSVATIQRRLRRLCDLGAIRQKRCKDDRRAVEVTLSRKVLGVLAKYGELLARNSG